MLPGVLNWDTVRNKLLASVVPFAYPWRQSKPVHHRQRTERECRWNAFTNVDLAIGRLGNVVWWFQ